MAAIVHAQFETIHPFPDGDGRVGRALIQAVLRAKGLVTNASVPVSAGLLVARAAHLDALGDYRTRNMTWRAQDILGALDEYSAEVGRRQR